MRQEISSFETEIESFKLYNEDCLTTTSRFSDNFIDLIYMDPPFCSGKLYNINGLIFDDKWDGINGYLDWMKPRLSEFKRILKLTGTIYIHCDWHISHYLKILADDIFGRNNFLNEIIWQRQSSHNDSKQGSHHFGRIHDIIFVYVKSQKYIWNQQYIPYSNSYVEKTYKFFDKETNRRYALGDLTGPGGEMKGNPKYEFMGFLKCWRYNKFKMNKLLLEGKIICKKRKLPRLKRYLDEMQGKPLQDIWSDIRLDHNMQYPTQKPVSLLERIISTSTNEEQIVYDPFAGSCTSGVASFKLSRKWIGSEISLDACNHSIERLESINCNVKLYPFSNTSIFNPFLKVLKYKLNKEGIGNEEF